MIHFRNRQYPAAVKAFRKAIEINASKPAAQKNLGLVYLLTGRASEAIGPLFKAAQLQLGDTETHVFLGQAFSLAGKYKEAEASLRRTLQLNPAGFGATAVKGHPKAASEGHWLNDEGLKLESQGDLQGALEKYRAAVQAGPFQTVFRRNLALVLCRMGRWEEGIVELKKVLELDPEDTEATQALYIALDRVRGVRK